jgi:hypothetical protein
MRQPQAVELNGITYRLYESPDFIPYREYSEPKIVSQPDIAGSSRPSRNARPDLLEWVTDDWSGGEGQQYINIADEDTFKRYDYNSSGAVNVLTAGEISLGFAWATSKSDAGSYQQGPYLAQTRYNSSNNPRNLAYLVDHKLWSMGAIDTWTDKGTVAADAGNKIAGPARYQGGFIFAAYKDGSGAANSSRVRRIIWDGTTLTTATLGATEVSNAENALPADSRLHVLLDSSGHCKLYRWDLDNATLTTAFTLVYTGKGTGSESGHTALGNQVHVVTQYANEEPRVHIWDGAKGFERWIAPDGFRMDTTPFNGASFLGDILYMGGYFRAPFLAKDIPTLAFAAPGRTGTVGKIRENVPLEGRIHVLTPTDDNIMLLGVYDSANDKAAVFVYDAVNAAISQLTDWASDALPVSVQRLNEWIFMGTRRSAVGSSSTIDIFRTTAGGSGTYSASAAVRSSVWDYGYSKETKLLHTLTVDCEPLPANTSVTFTITDETGTVISTDAQGNTMTFNTTSGTTKSWQISGLNSAGSAAVSRTGKRFYVTMTLATSASGSTPVVFAWTLKASILGQEKFFDMVLSIEDDTESQRQLPVTAAGEIQAENLRDLWDSNACFIFNPRFASGNSDWLPEGTSLGSASRWPKAVKVIQLDMRLTEKGNGFARVSLQEVNP